VCQCKALLLFRTVGVQNKILLLLMMGHALVLLSRNNYIAHYCYQETLLLFKKQLHCPLCCYQETLLLFRQITLPMLVFKKKRGRCSMQDIAAARSQDGFAGKVQQ